MLLECGARSKEEFENIQELATGMGKDSFSFAFLVNHLTAERERGISTAHFLVFFCFPPLPHQLLKRLMSMWYFVKGLVTLSASLTLQVDISKHNTPQHNTYTHNTI